MIVSRCFACNKKLTGNKYLADTLEDQFVHVGPECFKHIRKAGSKGYQPKQGGPRLYVMTPERFEYFGGKL